MKRNVLARRAASAALAACMMFSLSAPALAASNDALLQQSAAAKSAVSVLDEENDMMAEPAYEMNLKYGSIRVYIGEDGKQYAQQGDYEAQKRGNLQITTDGGRTTNTLTIEGGTTGAKVTLSNVNIDASGAAVSVSGNVELYITGTNILRSGWERAGLEKADDDGTLTIDGTGSLEAYGGNEAAGIGGGHSGKAENIRINGGVVTATGGEWGFGIGSGYNEYSLLPTTITITGGTVKAIAGKQGAAIGALASANDLNMTGGSLTVQKSNDRLGWIISTSSTIGEVDKNSLTGAITYLDQNGKVEDTANWDITVNGTAVNGVNYKDILGNGVLCYDIKEKTLKLKDGRFFDGDLTITAPEDVSIDLEANASHVVNGNLTVNGAKDVKVIKPGGDAAAAIEGKAEITCSGDVILQNWGGDIGPGRNLTKYGLTVHRANNVTTEGGISGEANINCTGNIVLGNEWGTTVSKLTVNSAYNVTVTSGSSYRSIENGVEITCSGTVKISGKRPIEGDVKIVAGQDVSLEYKKDGNNQNVINITAAGKVELNRNGTRNLGRVIFTQANDKPYVYFTDKSSEEFKDSRITKIPDTIESKYLRIEPRETYNITVKNGTAQVVGDTDGKLTTAFAGEKVTVSGKNGNPGVTKFGGWKVISPESFELTEEQKNTEENMTFTMPASPVELKASYSFPAPVLDMQVTVKGGTAKSTLDEGKKIYAKVGETVEITATPYDAEENPGMEFVEWEIKYPDSFYEKFPDGIPEELQLKLDKSATTTFEMPAYPVELTACWSASAVVKPDPDEPFDEDFGVEPAPMDTTGGAIAAVAVGGAAIWGGYEIATRVILNDLLPEGAAIPANRGQLALLVWNNAGRPEPAGAPAFADVADADMAKAAQWCTEQGILDAKGDRFEPEGWTPKFKVIEVWNKAFPKQ